MSDADQQTEIDRILALPERVDPFTVLGVSLFAPKPAPAVAAEGGEAPGDAGPSPAPEGAASDEPDYVRLPITLRDVTRAYRRLNLLLHPDKCSLPKAGDALHRVAEANKKLPSEATVERFAREMDRMKKRDWETARRRAAADEDRRRKVAEGRNGTRVVGGGGSGSTTGTTESLGGNGIANFDSMTMAQKVAAVAELDRAERQAEAARKAAAAAKKNAEDSLRAEEAKERGEELMKQAEGWSDYMDL